MCYVQPFHPAAGALVEQCTLSVRHHVEGAWCSNSPEEALNHFNNMLMKSSTEGESNDITLHDVSNQHVNAETVSLCNHILLLSVLRTSHV